METAVQIALWSVPVLTAIVFHEAAHGYVARMFGDTTAQQAGRLTLNPIVHVDLVGTLLVPALLVLSGSGILFGWAKPVPVNYGNLRNPKRDMMFVAAAGPATNLVMALAFAAFYHLVRLAGGDSDPGLARTVALVVAQYGILMNVFLGIFNLFPIPPLDGGRVLTGLLPLHLARPFARIEPFGLLVLIGLLMTGVLGTLVGPPARFILRLLLPAPGLVG